jgi:DNA primase
LRDADKGAKMKTDLDLVVDHFKLKPSGKGWRGLSPFRDERTPAFFVEPSRQGPMIWHDFASGERGTIKELAAKIRTGEARMFRAWGNSRGFK